MPLTPKPPAHPPGKPPGDEDSKRPVVFHLPPGIRTASPGAALPASSNQPLPGVAAFERKGQPESDGYSSETDDPPANYYHRMWRHHDRSRNPVAAERRARREMAGSWKRDEREDKSNHHAWIRSGDYRFEQPDGACMTYCAIFAFMRMEGYAPAEILRMLKQPSIRAKAIAWQQAYASNWGQPRIGANVSNFHARLFTEVASELTPALANRAAFLPGADAKSSVKAAVKPAVKPAVLPGFRGGNIIFEQLIGQFPVGKVEHPQMYHTNFEWQGKTAVSKPRMPPTVGATTFHQALFANFEEPRSFQASQGSFLRKRTVERIATPLVLVGVVWPGKEAGSSTGHAILVDFTDRAHPGIFDPNLGWVEPRQGFCYLGFEQVMHTIWEHYTHNNENNPEQGLRHLKWQSSIGNMGMLATQLYVQLA